MVVITLWRYLQMIELPGSLESGSRKYDVIVEMIEGWLHHHGPEKALEMTRKGARHIDVWRKHL